MSNSANMIQNYSQQINPLQKGTFGGNIQEWISGPSDSSSAGKQRIENEKARAHATSERMKSEVFNAEQAKIARDFEQYMSNTSYQRKMADLEKAGINPALAISGGGASTPTGHAARSSASPSGASGTADGANLLRAIAPMVSMVLMGVNSGAKAAAAASGTTLQNTLEKGQISAAANRLSKKVVHAKVDNVVPNIQELFNRYYIPSSKEYKAFRGLT